MYDAKMLASRVLMSRRDLDLDQKQLSEQSGVSRPYISQIERARKTNVSVDVLFSLADALGVTVQYLLGLSDDPLGEGSEKVLREQSGDYVVFEVESGEDRRIIQKLIDQFLSLTPRSQRLAFEYLRMMRQVEEEERERENRPPHIIGGDE